MWLAVYVGGESIAIRAWAWATHANFSYLGSGLALLIKGIWCVWGEGGCDVTRDVNKSVLLFSMVGGRVWEGRKGGVNVKLVNVNVVNV